MDMGKLTFAKGCRFTFPIECSLATSRAPSLAYLRIQHCSFQKR